MKFKVGEEVKVEFYTHEYDVPSYKKGTIEKTIEPNIYIINFDDFTGSCEEHSISSLTEPELKQDIVNHPSHYTNGKIECIDAIESAVTGLQGIEAVCTGHIIRYIWRWKFKNGLEDLKKCRFYLDKLIAKVEADRR